MINRKLPLALAVLCALTVAACSGGGDSTAQPAETVKPGSENGGLLEDIFGGSKGGGPGSAGIAVNSYLWRASLDTISFLPLSTADPFGGVIITDWYSPPRTPNERFKVTVYILDRQLRADGLRVAVFRQQRGTDRGWVESRVDDRTARDLENAILKRARQLRIGVSQR